MSETKQNKLLKNLLLAIGIILLLVIGWHVILAILGITFAITAGAYGVVVGTIVALCVAILLFFVFSGVGIFIVGLLAFIWAVVAIALFPIFFPLLVPVLVIMFFIGLFRRRQSTNNSRN